MADDDTPKGLLGWLGRLFAVADFLMMLGMLILFVFGALAIAVGGVLHLIEQPSMGEIEERHRAMTEWPATEGTIFELQVGSASTGRAGGHIYGPHVKYRYRVDGREYIGSQISMKPDLYQADSLEALERRVGSLVPGFSRQPYLRYLECLADKTVAKCPPPYPLDQPTTVYYDPQHPDQAVLDKLSYDRPSLPEQYAPAVISTGIGVVAVALLGAAIRRWRQRSDPIVLTAAEQASQDLASDAEHFRYVPTGFLSYLAILAFGATMLTFCVMYFWTQAEWRQQMDQSLAPFFLFGLLILPIGLVGAVLMLMPYCRTVIDFQRKTVVVTRWFLVLIPFRRSWSFAELRCVQLRVSRPAYKKTRIDHTVALLPWDKREAIELFSYRRTIGEEDGEQPGEIVEFAQALARRLGLKCETLSDWAMPD